MYKNTIVVHNQIMPQLQHVGQNLKAASYHDEKLELE
jgi:hypothetical protein